jgi:predicted nucleic acid-binding Zn ribbon protein
MFCDQCGHAIEAGQQFCNRCGKALAGTGQVVQRTRVHEHVRLLAIFWIAYSALDVIGGVVMIVLGGTMFGHLGRGADLPREALFWLRPLMVSLGSITLLKAGAGFFAGWGLLRREPWARILALIVGFLALLNLPLGTALGIYTLWVLLPAQSDREYRLLGHGHAA